MTEQNSFQPNWASPPGNTISAVLSQRGISKRNLAERLELTTDETRMLLEGQIEISELTATRLGEVIGGSSRFWLERDIKYRENLTRLAEQKEWLREIPWKEMVKLGWIKPAANRYSLIKNLLDFFGISNVNEWSEQYAGIAQSAAYRTTVTYASKDGAVSAWFRQGHLLAESIKCRGWNPEAFQSLLSDIRSLTREKDPAVFIPKLRKLCADCGVALVILKAPSGCRHSGVARFVSSDRALLLLSFRYLSDDHFWFTFFHEAAHLLLHNRNLLFLEGPDMVETKEEAEANNFASEQLIPSRFLREFITLKANKYEIVRFARKIGVSAGIVVGQLQHRGLLRRDQMNRLKRRFRWEA